MKKKTLVVLFCLAAIAAAVWFFLVRKAQVVLRPSTGGNEVGVSVPVSSTGIGQELNPSQGGSMVGVGDPAAGGALADESEKLAWWVAQLVGTDRDKMNQWLVNGPQWEKDRMYDIIINQWLVGGKETSAQASFWQDFLDKYHILNH